MNWEQISSILRHVLTFGGGFIVAKGWVSAETMTAVVGAIITIGSLHATLGSDPRLYAPG